MRGRFKFFVFLAVAALTMTTIGCSSLFKPSDEDAVKAINESGILKSASFQVTSPLTVVERGKQNADGSWPVKVKMTIVIHTADGKTTEPKENTATFYIYKDKDSSGNKVWKARLGSS